MVENDARLASLRGGCTAAIGASLNAMITRIDHTDQITAVEFTHFVLMGVHANVQMKLDLAK